MIAKIKGPCLIGRITTLSLGEGFFPPRACHRESQTPISPNSSFGCALQPTNIFGREEAMKKTKEQTSVKPTTFAAEVNF